MKLGVLGLAAALVWQTPAQPPSALTPGAVVLLAGRTDAAATDIVRRAFTDADRDVRRAASRVASVAHPEVFDALQQAMENEQDAGVLAEFVRDTLALGDAKAVPLVEPAVRRGGDEAVAPLAEWFARMQPDEFVARLPEWGRAPGSTARLAPFVELAVSRYPDKRDRILDAWKPLATEAQFKDTMKAVDGKPPAAMRTVSGLAAALLPDTLAAAGCKPRAEMLGSAQMAFSPVGRPTRIDVEATDVPDPCRTALVALSRISLEPLPSGGQPQTLVVPMSPEFVACAATPEPRVEIRVDGKNPAVASPRLKKEVKPNYTGQAMREKVEGVTEIEAVVSATGCVKSVSVTRSLVSSLDAQAIRALLQWRFEPGTLEGRPVSVIVNVEMRFTLRK
jgi:TonB family protein